MKLILTVLVTIMVKFLEGVPNADFQNRVFNGYRVFSKDFPYLTYIRVFRENRTTFCSGSLISHYYVLTAAHCVSDEPKFITIRLGIDNFKDKGLDVTCKKCWIVHSGYVFPQYPIPIGETGPEKLLDIALVKLPTYVEFSDLICPVQLPSYEDAQENLLGKLGTVVGWGRVNPKLDDGLRVLMAADSRIMDQKTCKTIFSASREPYDIENQFCTLHLKSGSCQGDSGGPFIVKGKQFGLVSGGTSTDPVTGTELSICGRNYGNNYMNVTRFLKWIEENSDVRIR